jgi:HlyD family secretion protein
MGEKLNKFIAILKKRRTPIALVGLLGLAVLVGAFFWGDKTAASDYITAKVERTNLEVNVSATGTVQAVVTVQVGSQVSGTVSWLGADFNAQVKKGQLVARLDPAIFQAQLDNASANVVNAEAAQRAAETEIKNQQANLQAAKANQQVVKVQRDDAYALVKRYQELQNVVPGRDIEAQQAQASAADARLQQAVAQVAQVEAANLSAKAKLEQAKASLSQARAQQQQSRVNLEHTQISSPIDGVVVSRNVDVGQTVAASLQAPTLFTIAQDLTKMQVLASIDEADVGQIKQGIKSQFTVDAYPGESFSGEISQVRLNAQTLQNVVTYSAVIDVENPELKLRPGMTANITIPVARRENVLVVPNAALRFRPSIPEEEIRAKIEQRQKEFEARRQEGGEGQQPPDGQQASAEAEGGGRPASDAASDSGRGGPNDRGGRRGPRPGANGQTPDGAGAQAGSGGPGGRGPGQPGQRRNRQMVWVLSGEKNVEPRFVLTGLTNGRMTEVFGRDLQEGDTIIVGQNENGSRPAGPTGAPFGQRPPMGGPGRGPR